MSQFLQLHILTSYPPSNLNRDDMGRPKTARMGGSERLRISSQSLKRHWRTSDLFEHSLDGHIGTRTKNIGPSVYDVLVANGVTEKKAKEWAADIANVFGKAKKEQLEIEQLVHVSQAEWKGVMALAKQLAEEQRAPEKAELELLRKDRMDADIALFGRMLASKPDKNIEAACQVAHAISVHSVTIEDDYFTAVDDLNDGQDDLGAAHIGERGFAAALFYSYLCINVDQLVENLNGNKDLADKTLKALTEAAVKVSPTGYQNSFGSRAYASYVLAEQGEQQPRSLSVAFLKPVDGREQGMALDTIDALNKQIEIFDQVYEPCADTRYALDAVTGQGSFKELLAFVSLNNETGSGE
tara:strand:+ start:434 stop:1498 length:1065 start_codon:yes stop_codon:yes gene_type:complete